jgi:4-amino-4-deoxy-L-arabinose transferase-like glycosyltransferase
MDGSVAIRDLRIVVGRLDWLVGHPVVRPLGRVGAALVQLTWVYVLNFSHKAEVDMLLCLLTTTALFLIAQHPADEPRRQSFVRWAVVLALVGVSWLAKFHYGPIMILSVCVVHFVVQREYRALLGLVNPLGLLVLAACVIVWPWLVLDRVPAAWETWQSQTVGRVLGAKGHDPFWFFGPATLMEMLPWSPLLWLAIPESWRRAWRDGDRHERFLWVWFVTQFVLVTASANKHHHYIMAALPGLALVLGRTVADFLRNLHVAVATIGRRAVWITSVACWLVAVAALIVIIQRWPYLSSVGVALAVVVGVSGPVAVLLLAKRRLMLALGTAGAIFVGCQVAIAGWLSPGRDSRLPIARFGREARLQVGDRAHVTVFGLGEHPVVYYVDPPVRRVESLDDMQAAIRSGQVTDVVTNEEGLQSLVRLWKSNRLLATRRYPDCPPLNGERLLLLGAGSVAVTPMSE